MTNLGESGRSAAGTEEGVLPVPDNTQYLVKTRLNEKKKEKGGWIREIVESKPGGSKQWRESYQAQYSPQ